MTDMNVFWSIHKIYIYIYSLYSDIHANVEAKICWKNTKAALGWISANDSALDKLILH